MTLDAKELKEILGSFQDIADQLVPPAPLLELANLPPVPVDEKRRPSFVRRLDGGSALDEAYTAVDAAIDPIHDLALAVFQRWLDNLAGHACPLHEDNKRLAAMSLERIDRWGFHLFMERKGELVEVRLDAKPARSSQLSNPTGRTASAGFFSIRSYDPARGRYVPLSDVATFPQLIAARDLEQAVRFWGERKSGVDDAGR